MNYPLISEYVEAKEKILCFYENINFYPSKIVYLLPDLFDKVIRELWLPHNLWENFSVNLVCWDKNRWTTGYDSILNSVVGEFSKKVVPMHLRCWSIMLLTINMITSLIIYTTSLQKWEL